MDPVINAKPRPYWHVDAKWITGFILVFTLSLAFLAHNLVKVTDEKPAIDALTIATATAFSRNGLDDETEVNKFREALKKTPNGSIQPIPALKITISEKDIANLSPRETRFYLFRKLAEPLYKDGPEGLAELASSPEMKKSLSGGVGPFGILSLKTHQTLKKVFLVLEIISFLLFIPLIIFSHRFGRLFSPGFVIFIASFPGAVMFSVMNLALQKPNASTPPAQGAEMIDMVGYIASNALPPIVQLISGSYLTFMLIGLMLMLTSLVAKLIYMFKNKRKSDEAGNTTLAEAV